jgi:O-antigen/teichoic acid export membrane protein
MQLLVVRIATEGLGQEEFPIFALTISLLSWSQLSDLGLGLSLQNSISQSFALKLENEKNQKVGRVAGLCIITVQVALAALLSPALFGFIFNKFSVIGACDKSLIIIFTSVFFVVTGVASIEYKILYGLRKGYIANILPIFSYALTIILFYVSQNVLKSGRLLYGIISYLLPGALIPLFFLFYNLYRTRAVKLGVNEAIARFKILLSPALSAFAFALMTNLALQLDTILISQFLPPADLAAYAILSRTIGLCYFIYVGLLMAIWPTIAEMASRNDSDGIKNIVNTTFAKGMLFAACFLGSAPIWIPKASTLLSPSYRILFPNSIIILAAICQILRMWTDTYSIVLQSTNNFRVFWCLLPCQAICNICAQKFLLPMYGLTGVYLSLGISSLLTVAWGLPWAVRNLMQDLSLKNKTG